MLKDQWCFGTNKKEEKIRSTGTVVIAEVSIKSLIGEIN
jgi:hypothetical protein